MMRATRPTFICTFALLFCLACGSKRAVQDYGPLGSFSLTKEDNSAFTPEALRGRPWVASFIFTRCRSICPALVGQLKVLDARLRDRQSKAHIVSISVDPEHDTPEVLRRYAEQLHADRDRWTFLTGARTDVHSVIVQHFKQAVGTPELDPSGSMDVLHTSRWVLVDKKGHIRGFFEGKPAGVQELLAALEEVEQE